VRLSPFWPDRPGLWFAHAEAQFNFASVTSKTTKFNYVVSQLEYRHAAEVEDIIVSPPVNEPYATLKAELVRRLSSSRDQRVRQHLTQKRRATASRPSFYATWRAGRARRFPEEHIVQPTALPHPDHIGWPSRGQTGHRLTTGRPDRGSRSVSHHSIHHPGPRSSGPAPEDRGSVPPSSSPDQWPHPTAL
jgi:hypothetical protein